MLNTEEKERRMERDKSFQFLLLEQFWITASSIHLLAGCRQVHTFPTQPFL
jgi:hypothetical protein